MKNLIKLSFCFFIVIRTFAQTSPQLVIDKVNEQTYPGSSNTIYGEGAGNRSQGNAFLNTFIGKSAGRAITTGNTNTIIGNAAGTQLTTGNNNIFVGGFAGASNTTGSENIILGTVSCINCEKNIFMGWGGTSFLPLGRNVLIGSGSFRDKKVGYMSNTFIGNEAGGNADSVSFGTFIGISAGQNARASGIMIGNMAGQGNRGRNAIFVGDRAGQRSRGPENIFIGHSAGQYSEDSEQSIFIGNDAVRSFNYKANCRTCTIIGNHAGGAFNKGSSNVFLGFAAGKFINEGFGNTFIGTNAGSSTFAGNPDLSDTKANNNTFMGFAAGLAIKEANENVFIGFESGRNLTKGNANIFIGSKSSLSASGLLEKADSIIVIGTNTQIQNDLKNSIAIGNNTRIVASNTMILGSKDVNIGIGTNTPKNKVEIVANTDNASGLRLTKLTSNATLTESNGKTLSVNESGDVILTKVSAVDYSQKLQQIDTRLNTLEAENQALRTDVTTAQATIADLNTRLLKLEQMKPRKCCWFCKNK